MPPPYTKTELGLYVADCLWSFCLIFPVLVIYWSGTWALADIYAGMCFPNKELVGSVVCIFIGSFVLIEAYFVLPLLQRVVVDVSWKSVKHVVISRISIYVCALGAVLFWRGAWNIVLLLMGDAGFTTVLAITVCAMFFLILFRASESPIGTPFAVGLDIKRNFYETRPFFGQQRDRLYWYTLDVLFSVYVISTLNIVLWVGLWKLGDALIFPNNNSLSMIVCLAAGCGCSAVIYGIWLPLHALDRRLSASASSAALLLGYFIQVAINIVAAIVVLLVWRGLWGLMLTYFATNSDQALFIAWICHVLGFLAMIALQVGSTLGSVGGVAEGEYFFTDWPTEYFIVYYRYKQRQQRLNDTTSIESQNSIHNSTEADAEQPLLVSTSESINQIVEIH